MGSKTFEFGPLLLGDSPKPEGQKMKKYQQHWDTVENKTKEMKP